MASAPLRQRSHTRVILALLAAAFAARLFLGATTAFVWDEEREWVYTADLISLVPGRIHTPYRVANHAAGAAYGMSVGRAALPGTRVGPRLVGIFLGVLAVAVAASMAGAMAGPTAAAWTAALVAFNEYHMAVSAIAVEMVYYTTFGALALFAFWRFLETDADRWLFAAAASLGVAYFCKEIAALLGPPMLLALVRRDGWRWLWRWRSWAAAAVVALFVVPDYVAIGPPTPASALMPADHLSRIQGLGVRYHPAAFYLYDLVRWGVGALGRTFVDDGAGYPYMNLVAGAVLLAGMGWGLLVARVWRTHLGWLLCSVFVLIVGWFSIIETDGGVRGLDPIGWQWVDLTLVPAAIVTGAWLAGRAGTWRAVTWAAAGLALVLGVGRVSATRLDMPALSAAACPEHLLASGGLQNVTIALGGCDWCAAPEAAIASVQVLGPGAMLRPARPDEHEIVTAGGRAPRLRLRTASATGETWGGWPAPWGDEEPARRYVVRLRPTTPARAPWWQRASEPAGLDVDVFIMPRPYAPHYRPVVGCLAIAPP